MKAELEQESITVISEHAIRRYREHHRRASRLEMMANLRRGKGVNHDVVWALTQRRGMPGTENRYVLSPDGWGVFVILPSADGYTPDIVKTYLRLTPSQRIIVFDGAKLTDPMPGETAYPPSDTTTLQLAKDIISAGPSMWPTNATWKRVSRLANRVCQLTKENRRLRHRLESAQKCLRDGFPETLSKE